MEEDEENETIFNLLVSTLKSLILCSLCCFKYIQVLCKKEESFCSEFFYLFFCFLLSINVKKFSCEWTCFLHTCIDIKANIAAVYVRFSFIYFMCTFYASLKLYLSHHQNKWTTDLWILLLVALLMRMRQGN